VAKRKQKSYDRIFRENIEQLVVPLAHRLLDLTIPALEEIPDDLHQTIERKPDFLKKVVFPEGVGNYILHFEFQTADDSEMLERMLEYYALLWRKYQLPVRQYVFYIGEGISQMRHGLYHELLQYQYSLISASEVDYRLFLSSTVPEEVLLTVLSDFKQVRSESVLESVILKLTELVPRSLRLKRYLKQLEILSQLRNLQEVVINVSDKMALVYELKKDIRYQQGIEQGIEQGIIKMIRKGTFSREVIAETFDVPIERVQAIAEQLTNQP
jgi:hypothetical protein